jgi:hypothetical protein
VLIKDQTIQTKSFCKYSSVVKNIDLQGFEFEHEIPHFFTHNLMFLNNEMWFLTRLSNNIQSMVDNFTSCFTSANSAAPIDRVIKRNNNNHTCIILILVLLLELTLGVLLE